VVTVDAPVLGRRERDVRSGFSLRRGLSLANVDRVRAATQRFTSCES
jgi:isopentenyl diphosphate isomerase/L-lactate dehydrogenase-like FMN-dependent dehydrogenase